MQQQQMDECIEACNDCRDECEKMLFQHCLKVGGKHVEQKHIQLMADCVEICQTAANFMLRGSDNATATCGVCAEICDSCADSCEELDGMEDCAKTCRECAETCRSMAGSGGMRRESRTSQGANQSM